MTAKGKTLQVQLTAGHRHEATVARDLLEHARGKYVVADAGYDSDELVDEAKSVGLKPVICQRKNRKNNRRKNDPKIYRTRYLVEVFFHHIKRYRAIATRYEKTAHNFLSLIQLACSMIWLKSNEGYP